MLNALTSKLNLTSLGPAFNTVHVAAFYAALARQSKNPGHPAMRRVAPASLNGRDRVTCSYQKARGDKAPVVKLYESPKTGMKHLVDLRTVPDSVREAGFQLTRNSPCPCRSGKRFKACCQERIVNEELEKDREMRRLRREVKRYCQRKRPEYRYPLNVRTGMEIAEYQIDRERTHRRSLNQ